MPKTIKLVSSERYFKSGAALYTELPVYRTFEAMGLTWCIHDPLCPSRRELGWAVSELSTGAGIGVFLGRETLDHVEEDAKRLLEIKGEAYVKEYVKKARDRISRMQKHNPASANET